MLCTRRPGSSVTDARRHRRRRARDPSSPSAGTSGGGSSANARYVSAATPGPQPVADQPPELLERDPLARGAQVRLLREPLGVEGEHVGGDGPRVEQRDREVVARRACRASASRGRSASVSPAIIDARKSACTPTRYAIAERPGRFSTSSGVRCVDARAAAAGRRRSLAASRREDEHAVLGEARGRRRAARSRAGPSAARRCRARSTRRRAGAGTSSAITDCTPGTACAAATIADR